MATSRDSVKKVSGNHIEFRPIQSQAGIGLHSRGTSFNGCCSVYKGANGSLPNNKKVKVVFVLGGPGSGKGTQCANIVEHFGYTHLSAGDLLRAEVKSGSKNGIMIQRMIKEGQIVPSKVTIALLQRAIQETENDKFLIDGFPRNEENREAFERITGIQPDFVLFFDCTEEEMQRRLLNRNHDREDDNIDIIRKRFKVYKESTLPVIEYYKAKGKVRKIDAAKPVNEVFEAVKTLFTQSDGKVKQRCDGLDKVNLPCYAWKMIFRRSIV